MKTLFNALAVVAIANLVALGGLVGWLKATDRLDVERARKVREVFTPTLTAEKAAQEAQAKQAEEAKKQAEEEAKASRPPLTATERLAARIEATELDLQRAERLKREVDDLQRRLQEGEAKLATERAAFETERSAFNASTQRQRDLAKDEQFQKTLGVLAALKPADAVKVLLASSQSAAPAASPVDTGTLGVNGSGTTQAPPARDLTMIVEYLNAMDDRPRSKLMTEIVKTDEALAAELLEQLRLRGQLASGAKDTPR